MKVAMTKGDDGVWSATVGPLKPEYYVYVFVVDGVQAQDPRNIFRVRDGQRYGSALHLAGGFTSDYAVNDVPHGTLHLVWYPSPGAENDAALVRVHAAGIRDQRGRYPVFYLLHGGGGDEDAWTTLGGRRRSWTT